MVRVVRGGVGVRDGVVLEVGADVRVARDGVDTRGEVLVTDVR